MTAAADPLQRVEDALSAAGCSPRGGAARCPAHSDSNPSLAFGRGDKAVVLYCHAGCDTKDVLAALNLQARDLFYEQQANGHGGFGTIEATYTYTDAEGEALYQVVKYRKPDGDKTFRQKHPEGGRWVTGRGGAPLVPYNLPAVLRAIRERRRVYVVEGEKDADALARYNAVGTCNVGGAGKWAGYGYSRWLAGGIVTVVADNDAPGFAHARAVANELEQVVESVDLVRPIKGKDIADLIALGGTSDDLVPLDDDTEAPEPEEPEPEGPGYLVDLGPWLDGTVEIITPEILPRDDGKHLFYRGQLNWVHGDSGSGKTWIALAAAQHEIAAGRHVLWIHYEDPNPGAVTERLQLLGLSPAAILAHFHYWNPEGEGLLCQVDRILERAGELGADLLVIDSIGEALNADGRNEDSDAEVGPWIVSGPRAFVNAGHTFIGIDHGTKSAQNPLHSSGSKRKRAAVTGIGLYVEAVIAPTREADGLLRVKCAKDRHGTYQQGHIIAMIHVDHEHLSGGLTVTARAPLTPQDQAIEDRERLIRAVVREVTAQPGMGAKAIARLLPSAAESKKLAAITLAAERGEIRNLGTASHTSYHPVDNFTTEGS